MLKKQIIKFIAVGIVNTLVYYFLYSLFIYLEFDYKIAVLFATISGVLFSFKTFGKFVFDNDDKKLIYKFIFVYIILYLLNLILITNFNILFANYYMSGFFASICISVFTFILNKKFVFKKEIRVNGKNK